MTGTPLRLGIVGTGRVAWTGHLPAIARSSSFVLVAASDVDPGRVAAVVERWPDVRPFTEPAALIESGLVDAVIVATPPESHLEIAAHALRRGLGVYLEKPMVRTTEEADQLRALASETGRPVAVGHQMRFHPTYQRVAALVRDGSIGTPYFMGMHWATNVKLDPARLIPPGYDNYLWRWRDATVGGGILQDHLPHVVDLVRYWTRSEPRTVVAHTLNVARDLMQWEASASYWEDFAVVLLQFDAGLVLRLETGTVGRSLSPIWSLGAGVGEWTQYGYILGTGGQLVFDFLPWDSSENGRIATWTVSGAAVGRGWSYVEQPEPDRTAGSPGGAAGTMFLDQLEAFARLLRGEPTDVATLADGVASIRIVEAAYRSAEAESLVQVAHRSDGVGS